MKTLSLTTLLIALFLIGCDQTVTSPTTETTTGDQQRQTDVYRNTIELKGNESVEINNSIVGFFPYGAVSLQATGEFELFTDNGSIPRLKEIKITGAYLEAFTIRNHNDTPITIQILIRR